MEIKRFQPFSGRVRGLFTFALLCVYALLCCLLVLAGLRVYNGARENTEMNYDGRTALAYITAKLRGGAELRLSEDVLCFGEDVDGERYYSYIYCREGYLCEYFGSAEREVDPQLGEPLAKASSLKAVQEGELVCVKLTDELGAVHDAYYRVRTGEEAQR